MKYLFLGCFLVLAFAYCATIYTEPDQQSEVPVLYWVTDANPARVKQIEYFHQWLIDNGYTTEDGKPILELRTDSANKETSKKIIQGVAGVAGDIMDCPIPSMQSIGLLEDVTDKAKELGFDISHTYSALESYLTVDGRQYGFPCNVNIVGFWINADALAQVGMEPPPREWDFETFEAYGKEFIRRANPPGERHKIFWCNSTRNFGGARWITTMHRSLGLSRFNETMTRCTVDDERFARVNRLLYKWTFEDRIVPSAADEAAFDAEGGYGGAMLSLFQSGNYASIIIGRWCLIRIRDFANPPRLSESYFPYDPHFPNAVIGTRAAGVYAGGKHKDLATLFLAYLASEPYNRTIVEDADALPPNPAFTQSEEYLRPKGRENEWGCHEVEVEAAQTIAIPYENSPFVQDAAVERIFTQGYDKIMANMATPEEGGREIARRIDEEIQLTLKKSETLRAKYETLLAKQQKIDERLARGEKVPLEWIDNPFHRRYYAAMGMLEDNEAP